MATSLGGSNLNKLIKFSELIVIDIVPNFINFKEDKRKKLNRKHMRVSPK